MPHGGKRPGAGRPPGEPTKVLSVRVPARIHAELKPLVETWIKRWLRRRART